MFSNNDNCEWRLQKLKLNLPPPLGNSLVFEWPLCDATKCADTTPRSVTTPPISAQYTQWTRLTSCHRPNMKVQPSVSSIRQVQTERPSPCFRNNNNNRKYAVCWRTIESYNCSLCDISMPGPGLKMTQHENRYHMGLPSAQVKRFHFLSSYFSRNRLNDLWTLTPGTNRPNVFSDPCRHHDVRQHHQRHSAPADQSELTNVKFCTGTNLPIIYMNTLQVNPDWLSPQWED